MRFALAIAAATVAAMIGLSAQSASPDPAFVAFRTDPNHVVAVVGIHDSPLGSDRTDKQIAEYGFPFIDANDAIRAGVDAGLVAAKDWTVHIAPGRDITATAERIVMGHAACEGKVGVLLRVDAASQAAFAAVREKYFVAEPRRRIDRGVSPVRALPLVLSVDRRSALEAALTATMRAEFPAVQLDSAVEIARMAESTVGYHRSWAAERVRLDALLMTGKARLTYDVQAFRLARDLPPLYFVRAEWRVGTRPAFGFAAWMKEGGFEIFDLNLSPARFLRMFEFQGELGREQYGLLLNVLDRDGNDLGEILFARGGYESMGIQLREYSPDGFVPTGISYDYGC